MKTTILAFLALISLHLRAQSIIGTWQLTDEKTCFESGIKESDTEKELLKDMGASRTGVARVIRFDKKEKGEEGIFSSGIKKGTSKSAFKYQVSSTELHLMDPKSGIMTRQFIIDELTASTLRIHNAQKDCETMTFVRIK